MKSIPGGKCETEGVTSRLHLNGWCVWSGDIQIITTSQSTQIVLPAVMSNRPNQTHPETVPADDESYIFPAVRKKPNKNKADVPRSPTAVLLNTDLAQCEGNLCACHAAVVDRDGGGTFHRPLSAQTQQTSFI